MLIYPGVGDNLNVRFVAAMVCSGDCLMLPRTGGFCRLTPIRRSALTWIKHVRERRKSLKSIESVSPGFNMRLPVVIMNQPQSSRPGMAARQGDTHDQLRHAQRR